MKELNTDILVEIVDEFLAPLDCDSDFDADFYYDEEENTVYFSVLVAERAERLFKQYVKTTFNFETPNIFVLSLLHEVGHAQTLGNFSKKEKRNAHKQKEIIEKELKINDNDEVYSRYFDINIEKVATAWAVKYYQENVARCEKFYNIFEKELHKQFIELGLNK